MGFRFTGISTPFGGISWEYKEENEKILTGTLVPGQKIKVFISSIYGVPKYDRIRMELKKNLEATQLMDVYTFERKGASTLSAENHHTWALEESDVCIFLIDNADGVREEVQKEIDIVQKYNIKALYYFCDETAKDKTPLEKSLIGAKSAKSKTVRSFDDMSHDGAQSLIDEIVSVYHYYCAGKLVEKQLEKNVVQDIDVVGTEKYQASTIPTTIVKNVEKCKAYILDFVFGYSRHEIKDKIEKTSVLDEWADQFLPVLFEGKNIKNFNVSMYLDELQRQQDTIYFKVVQIRWQAIQAYFAGNLEKCLEHLESALKAAKETKQSSWIIKDILIDLRNIYQIFYFGKNKFAISHAQKELDESEEVVYYPILDRIHQSLDEKYIKGFYDKKMRAPFTITFGSNLNQYAEMIASSIVVSMYNGSLSHIILIYEKLKKLMFYLSCNYSEWIFKLNLFKLAIFIGKESEIKSIQDSYPEILNKLTSDDAASVMDFCMNHPIRHERFNSQLLAFGAVGYYLDEQSFVKYEKTIVHVLEECLNNNKFALSYLQNTFKCLSTVSYRMKQDTLGNICCRFISKKYRWCYIEMFKFIAHCMNLNKMSDKSARYFIGSIISIFDDDEGRKLINYAPIFLCTLRNQNTEMTDKLDKKIKEYFPKFYEEIYKLETAQNKEQDYPAILQNFIGQIKNNNETQGLNGTYYGNLKREIETVRTILVAEEIEYSPEIMDLLIVTISDTLLNSKEGIPTKLDAITLLICVVLKYPKDYMRNQNIYEKIYKQKELIQVNEKSMILSNIDEISLEIGLQFLFVAMGKDVYSNILELMPCIQDDIESTIAVIHILVRWLESTDTTMLPEKVEPVILQNVLQWLQSENLDIRWNAVRILFAMSRNVENQGLIDRQLVNLINSDGVYIKNLILRNIYKIDGIKEATKEYIISKCKNDANFIVRMVCLEIEEC